MSIWVERKPKIKYDDDDSILEKVAKVRGIKDLEAWINPSNNKLHNPHLLENIDKVVEKIVDAVYKGKKITIMPDCKQILN